jgi:N-acetyl-gamma-glutamyl-phosphate reductase
MKPKVYIDGKEGTTGLQIYDRLGKRDDIDLLLIDEEKRKDLNERKKLLNAADLVFLCLPDDAAREAVAMVENTNTRVIDASTAHRVAAGWVYGFPELFPHQRDAVRSAKRVANPGCHATGFLACAAPLVQMGILPKNYPVTSYSLTGYSGGGKKLIAEYEDKERNPLLAFPGTYGLNLDHKHLAEMTAYANLEMQPVFCPILDDYYEGMATTLMLHNPLLSEHATAESIWKALDDYYKGQTFITVAPLGGNTSRLHSGAFVGTNRLELTVSGNEDRTIITAQFDNLGKGASGAAVQNMNLMLGFDEAAGL